MRIYFSNSNRAPVPSPFVISTLWREKASRIAFSVFSRALPFLSNRAIVVKDSPDSDARSLIDHCKIPLPALQASAVSFIINVHLYICCVAILCTYVHLKPMEKQQ